MSRLTILPTCCAVLLCACEADREELEINVTVEGEAVSFNWDGRAVHEVTVVRLVNEQGEGRGAWQVSIYEDSYPQPRREPTIVPPLFYAQSVDNTFVLMGPEALVRGTTYTVDVNVYGWSDQCDGVGDDTHHGCSVAAGRATFTF